MFKPSKTTKFTIIDNKDIRGVLAPANELSREQLENIVDFLELSSLKMGRETRSRIREADKRKSWMTLGKVQRLAE